MYIGNDLQIAHPSYKIIDDISSGFNGSTTSFALQVSGETPVPFPISTQQVMISVNGVVQEPDPSGSAGFKLLGSNIVFSSAPANGHAFFGVINAGADYVTAGSEFPDGSATAPSFTFQDDQDTGWFRNASGDVGYSSNGSAILNFDGNGLTIAAGKGLTVDTSTLKVDAANNRVGIGLTAPSKIVHIASNATSQTTATIPGIRIENTDTTAVATNVTGEIEFFSKDASEVDKISGFIKNVAEDAGTKYALTFGSKATGSNATERMRLDSSGRLGIGTTSPEDLLHIKSGKIRIENAIVSNNDSTISYDNQELIIDVDPNNVRGSSAFQVKIDGTLGLVLDDSRRLMLATSVNTNVSNNADDIVIGDLNTSNETGLTISSTAGSSIRFNDNAGYAGGLEYSHSDNTLRFSSNAAERVRIDSSGKVGIGTTSPTGNLSIASGTYQSTTPLSTADDIVISGNQSLGISLITAAAGTSNNTIAFGDTDDTDIGMIRYAHANNSLQFTTNASERMRIDSSGRIGIGTTSPTGKLSVHNSDDSNLNTIEAFNDNGNMTGSFSQSSAGDGTIGSKKNDGTLSVFLRSNGISYINGGDVGIGTTSPAVKLEVEKSIDVSFSAANSIIVANNLLRLENSSTNNSAFAGIQFRTGDGGDGFFGSYQGSSANDCTFYWSNQTDTGAKVLAELATATDTFTVYGTVSDSLGDVRKIPNNATTSAYTLSSSDVGKAVTNTSGGVTVPNGVFAGGSAVTIINHSGSDITITQASGLTLHNAADATTGNRTLAGRGMATIWFQASSVAYISGAGLS